jgi:GTPase KRas protein
MITLTNAFPDDWLAGVLNGQEGFLPSGFTELIAIEVPAPQQHAAPQARQLMPQSHLVTPAQPPPQFSAQPYSQFTQQADSIRHNSFTAASSTTMITKFANVPPNAMGSNFGNLPKAASQGSAPCFNPPPSQGGYTQYSPQHSSPGYSHQQPLQHDNVFSQPDGFGQQKYQSPIHSFGREQHETTVSPVANRSSPTGGTVSGLGTEIRVVVVGSGGVGKSALTICFVQNHFIVDYDPTIEDSYRKQVTVDDASYLLNILDTAGQEEYSAMRDLYMRKGQGFILVFSMTDRATFEEIGPLRDKILQVKDANTMPMVVAANKWDLHSEHQLSKQEAEEYCRGFGSVCLMTSAKDHYNVDELFTAIVREIRKSIAPVDKKRRKGKGICSIL